MSSSTKAANSICVKSASQTNSRSSLPPASKKITDNNNNNYDKSSSTSCDEKAKINEFLDNTCNEFSKKENNYTNTKGYSVSKNENNTRQLLPLEGYDNDGVKLMYNYKSTKGRVFMSNHNSSDAHTLPVLLPKGTAYFANYLPLSELYALAVPERDNYDEVVSLTSGDVHLLYEAKCIDQHLVPSWEREVHFMELISENCQGNYLLMPESGFGEQAAAALAHILSTNSVYSVVNLNGNRIRDNGAEALAHMLRLNDTIVHLGLSSNDIGGRGGEAIAHALEFNNTIVSLDLGVKTGINGNHITVRGAEALGHMLKHNKVLSSLYLGGNGLGVMGISHLVHGLRHNNTLTHLDLSSNSLGNEGAVCLATLLQETEQPETEKDAIAPVKKENKDNAKEAKQNKQEKINEEEENELEESHCALTHLSLQRNNIDDDGGKVLFHALQSRSDHNNVSSSTSNNETLTHINLEHNQLGELSAHALHDLLLSSHSLQSIRLSNNSFASAGSVIFDGLASNKSCKELWLNKCHLRDVAVWTSCGNALSNNHTLKSLCLAENAIKDAAVIELVRGLKVNKTLTFLDLSNNRIGDDGGHALASLIETNTSMKRIYLRRNIMTNKTGLELSESVRVNNTLEELDVSYNDFTFQCIMDIKHYLQRNTTRSKRLLIPKLNSEIERLLPKEKELSQVEDFIETEKRMIKDRSEQLLRRNEEARVVAERLRREVLELEKALEEVRSHAEEAEEHYRECEDKATNETTAMKMKKTSIEARTQQEKDRVIRMQRDIDRMRRQIHQLTEAENKTQMNIINELEELEQELTRSQQDCQDEMNKTLELEKRIAEAETKRNATLAAKKKKKTTKSKERYQQ